MKLKQLGILTLLPFVLQGCFFAFIPGSVVSSISDSITGAEGSNCVASTTQVGDNIRLPGGSTGAIKSLSGTSSRCTDSRYPIRALLVGADGVAPTKPVPVTSDLRIDLPIGWERKPLTDPLIANGAVMYALNRTIDSGVILSAAKREGITDLLTFAQTRRANQASRLTETTQSEITELRIKERKAFRFTVSGSVNNRKFMYQMTIVEGASEIAIVNAWASPGNFELQAEALSKLSELVTGL